MAVDNEFMKNFLFMEWREGKDYNCLGMGWQKFFPEEITGVLEAKAICEGCPLIEECLEYAITNGENFGVWGGTSERERMRIGRRRRGMNRLPISTDSQ